MISLGFTGTRRGFSPRQREDLLRWLEPWAGVVREVHHGDCEGSDEEFHEIAGQFGFERHVHPPVNARWRAYCQGEVTYLPEGYSRRNRDIVNRSTALAATPWSGEDRSGTWQTIRYAQWLHLPVQIFFSR